MSEACELQVRYFIPASTNGSLTPKGSTFQLGPLIFSTTFNSELPRTTRRLPGSGLKAIGLEATICAALPKSWDRLIQLFVRPGTSIAASSDRRLLANLEHGIAMTMSKEKSDA